MNNKQICLNQSVLRFMDSVIDRTSMVLEIGAGWSSLWFAQRCGKLITIETEPKWAHIVRAELMGVHSNWRVLLHDDPGEPLESMSPEIADLVLVDCAEAFRERCTRLAWPLVKAGGWLVFDDAQRPQHAESAKYMNQFGEPMRLEFDPYRDIDAARERLALAWHKSA